jgi:ABC-type multidrug transport system permease subunit
MPVEVGSPLWEITRARWLEFLRQPEALFWVFGFPVIMAVVLGLAFRSRPPAEIPVGVVGSGDAAGRVAAALDASPLVAVVRLDDAGAGAALRDAEVDLLVSPREGSPVGAGAVPPVLFRYDPQREEARAARLAADAALQAAAGRRDPLPVAEAQVRERGLRYVDFLMPGLIGLNLMSSALWGLSFALVMMRAGKLLRRFAATPMRRWHFLAGLMLSRLAFLVVQVAFLLVFGWLAFGVEVRGSLLDLALLGLLATFAFTGLAMLVASRARTIEGASGIANAVMLPMWLLAGSFFSYERYPAALHPFIRALPLTALNDAFRSVMNDGQPLVASWPQLLVLAFWAVVPFVVALRLFRWS